MPTSSLVRSRWSLRLRAVRTAVLLGSVAALAGACDDDEEDDEPEIQAVRLTVTPPNGTATQYIVRTNGVQGGGPIQLRVGQNRVEAAGLDENNQIIDLENEFELRLVGSISGDNTTPLPAGFEFTANRALSNTLTVSTPAVGQRTVALQMFHRGENHSDFDANGIAVVTTP